MSVCVYMYMSTHIHTQTHTHTQSLSPMYMHHIGVLYSWLRHMHMRTSMHGACICRETESHGAHVHAHGACAWGTCMCMLMDTAGMCWWSV